MTDELDAVLQTASEALGFDALHGAQEDAISASLSGSDVLAVLPTGGGKSAIYQLAGDEIPGLTVVVSPLLALQRDQIGAINRSGLDAAAALDGTMSKAARRRVVRRASAGELEYLFCTAEQLTDVELLDELASARVSLIAVDEAHCIATWGRDFRPAYQRLGDAVDRLGRPRVIALTASATPAVEQEIIEQLRLDDPVVIRQGIVRPNIDVAVDLTADREESVRALAEALHDIAGKVLVYVPRRSLTVELAERFSTPSRPALGYAGSMKVADREAAHRLLGSGQDVVIVATTAFGLGIDVPDVRAVLHLDVPETLDSYYQELGRAGRDGEPASAVLFHSGRHASRRRFAAGTPSWDVADAALVHRLVVEGQRDRSGLAKASGLGAGVLQSVLAELGATGSVRSTTRAVLPGGPLDLDALAARQERAVRLAEARQSALDAYLATERCRWQHLAGYYGEAIEPCGHCDNCRSGRLEPSAEPVQVGDVELVPGARVEHDAFGAGTVTQLETDAVTISFDDAGSRRLDVELLAERELLAPPEDLS